MKSEQEIKDRLKIEEMMANESILQYDVWYHSGSTDILNWVLEEEDFNKLQKLDYCTGKLKK